MLTFTEYFLQTLTEANKNDPRQNPPKFTSKENLTNLKLFRHVAAAVKHVILTDYKDEHINVGDDGISRVYFVAAYALKGNKNYRNAVEIGSNEHMSRINLGIEILTDSTKNIVQITYRDRDLYPGSVFKDSKKENQQWVKTFGKAIEAKLKLIADSVKRVDINTGTQFGYRWTLTNPDYDKCTDGKEISSVVTPPKYVFPSSQLDRQHQERSKDKYNHDKIMTRAREAQKK